MATGGSVKVILGSFLANLGIAVSKFVAAWLTGSGAMLAEGIHSLADCTNQVLLYVGTVESKKPPTPAHPLGRGRAAYFWSFMVALMIFLGGGIFSAYEGWHKLQHPEPLESPFIALGVLLVAIGIESAACSQCLKAINAKRGTKPLLEYVKGAKDIDLIVILAEDSAAICGLVLAFVAVLLAWTTGDVAWDAYGTMGIGVLLCIVAVWLARKVKSLLQGESADVEIEAAFRAEAKKHAQIADVIQVLTLQQGPGQVMLAAKVRLAPGLTTDQVVDAINRLEANVKAQLPEVHWQFVEPDNAV